MCENNRGSIGGVKNPSVDAPILARIFQIRCQNEYVFGTVDKERGISRSKTDGRRRLKESLVGNGWVRPTRSSTLLVFLLVQEDVCRHRTTGPRCWVPIIIRSKNISSHSIKSAAIDS